MAMQDLHRLEQLGSTAALGMWANDTILALDRIERGQQAGEEDFALLQEAADALQAASREQEQPDSQMPSSLAFIERALDVAERLTVSKGNDAALELLAELSRELSQIVETQQFENAEKIVNFFATLSRQQLAATQSVLNSPQEASWTAGPATLSFF
jgi:hypothetical protein